MEIVYEHQITRLFASLARAEKANGEREKARHEFDATGYWLADLREQMIAAFVIRGAVVEPLGAAPAGPAAGAAEPVADAPLPLAAE